jgi:serine/threonine-protein kinase
VVPGYEILGELGRGGMGVVYRARQVRLDRPVALKMVLAGGHAGAAELARFRTEAESVARLQHPNIVQIHEVGESGGLPFFSLEYCGGGSLDRQLNGTPWPARKAAELVETLARAVHAAHRAGVVHRDLKPANVLLTRDGQPKITDFGLAKRLDVEKGQTQSGSILGTPSYMAPEQAGGKTREIGPAADVYALGAILYELLTGRPPFRAETPLDTVLQVVSEEPAPPRRLNAKVPRDLETICLKCLHKEPGKRYATAEALAEDLRRFQADEPILARPVGASERAAKWVKRRPALAALLAVSALATLVGAFWVQRQAAERAAAGARQREAVESALEKAGDLQHHGRWTEARTVLEQASERLDEAGPADLRQRVQQATADLALVDHLEDIRLRRATIVDGRFDSRGAERDYAATFRDAGLGTEGEEPATVAARLRASAVADPLVAALDDWAMLTGDAKRRGWLLETARRADPDPWRDRFRDPEVWGDRVRLGALAKELLHDQTQLARQSPQLLTALGDLLESGRTEAPVLVAAQIRHPGDFWLNLYLATTLRRAKKLDEAIAYYRAALAVRPSAAAVHLNIGVCLAAKHARDAAVAEYGAAIALDPKYAAAHNNLGIVLREKRQLDAAIREYHTAIALDPKYPHPHHNLGLALRDKRQLDAAIREYRTAIALDPTLAPPHYELGSALAEKQKVDAAIREFRRAITLDPSDPDAHYNLGVALLSKQRPDAAMPEFRATIALDPRHVKAHANLGAALHNLGQWEAACTAYRKAIDLDPKIAVLHGGLGENLLQLGRFAEARDAVARCLDLFGPDDPRRGLATRQLRQCEQLLALDEKLGAVLEGKAKPALRERLTLAAFCQMPVKRFYAASARFYAQAFAQNAQLAAEMRQQFRYNAACAAALAGCGQGRDAAALAEQGRIRLRKQAVDWLRADLAYWGRLARSASPADRAAVRQALRHWQADPDLVGLRDQESLKKLPAEEREACAKLWADVAGLLKQA